MMPKYMVNGIAAKVTGMISEKARPNFLMYGVYFL
jgi:hypothetical protein